MKSHTPQRPLTWPDTVLDLRDLILDWETPPVYIVGGAVRDAYLSRPVRDLDIAVPHGSISLARQIANALDGGIFVMDDEREIARVIINTTENFQPVRLIIDIARFRGDDLLADLNDRDFTVNAMAVDFKGELTELIDPLDGEKDLLAKVIRRCSPRSIPDDPIRALRAIRQSLQLKARIEPETLADIRGAGPRLLDTSPERVRDELMKTLALPRPAVAMRLAHRLGLLQLIFPELDALDGLAQPKPHIFDALGYTFMAVEKMSGILQTIGPQRSDATAAAFNMGMIVMSLDLFRKDLLKHITHNWPDERSHGSLLVLAALLHILGKPDGTPTTEASARIAAQKADLLRLSKHEKRRLVAMIRYQDLILHMPNQLTDLDMHRYWYTMGESGVDICLLTLATHLATVGNEINQDVWLLLLEQVQILLNAYYKRYDEVVVPPQLVDGNDLMEALDLEPGRIIADLLTHIREQQVTGEVKTAEDALAAARAYLS